MAAPVDRFRIGFLFFHRRLGFADSEVAVTLVGVHQ